MRPRKTLLEVLGDKVLVGDDCWEWIGGRGQDGYGHVAVERRSRAAHRVVYELLVGPIPEGLQLDHLCRNRSCVRPAHLEPVTCRENLLRGNTLAAANVRKTHCRNGHEYTPKNTAVNASGERRCRKCAVVHAQKHQRAKRLAATSTRRPFPK